jgi:hypothetical protein
MTGLAKRHIASACRILLSRPSTILVLQSTPTLRVVSPAFANPLQAALSREALMRPCGCLLVILEAAERATALLENATPRFMRVRVAHWSLETPAFSVKTPWCTNLDFCMAQWRLMAHQETVADPIKMVSKPPLD